VNFFLWTAVTRVVNINYKQEAQLLLGKVDRTAYIRSPASEF